MVFSRVYILCIMFCGYAFSLELSDGDTINKRLQRLEDRLVQQENVLKYQSRRIKHLEDDLRIERKKARQEKTELDNIIKNLFKIEDKQNDELIQLRDLRSTKFNKTEQGTGIQATSRFSEIKMLKESKKAKDIQRSIDVHRGSRLLLPATTTTTTQVKPVAFYAYMSKTLATPSTQHTLLFDTVKTNIGGAYNSFSGIFTVPVDGIYVFFYSVHVFCHSYASVEIVQNAAIEGFITADADEACDHEYSTGSVVLSAAKGNLIFVRTHSSLVTKGLGIYSGPYGRPTFSGWLIY